ncbi:MAG: OsmC family protein [Alphaproteobacteria bacterium]|nr:OsmC family protein [Alphaproteobacteria bacterium]
MGTYATAQWKGGLKDGKGTLTTKSGVLKNTPYDFKMRFEDAAGTNPEELIGAAHAGCFTMALSAILGEAGLTAEQMDTRCDLAVEKDGDGFAVKKLHLTLKAKIPGASNAVFQDCAAKAKAGCPISKLLKADITLDASLV